MLSIFPCLSVPSPHLSSPLPAFIERRNEKKRPSETIGKGARGGSRGGSVLSRGRDVVIYMRALSRFQLRRCLARAFGGVRRLSRGPKTREIKIDVFGRDIYEVSFSRVIDSGL